MRHPTGVLPMVALARERRIQTVFVPAADAPEAALVEGVTVLPVASLPELVNHLAGAAPLAPCRPDGARLSPAEPAFRHDLQEVRGQNDTQTARPWMSRWCCKRRSRTCSHPWSGGRSGLSFTVVTAAGRSGRAPATSAGCRAARGTDTTVADRE